MDTLENIARQAVNINIKDSNSIKNLDIPFSLKEQLCKNYIIDNIKCREYFNPIECNEIYKSLEDHFLENNIINVKQYLFLMWHPREIPNFVFESNFIRYTAYERNNFRMCTDCFNRSDKIGFHWVTNHTILPGCRVLEEVIWNTEMYCSECTIQNLFTITERQFYHQNTHKVYWDIHVYESD